MKKLLLAGACLPRKRTPICASMSARPKTSWRPETHREKWPERRGVRFIGQ
jgi:hypothetical protein